MKPIIALLTTVVLLAPVRAENPKPSANDTGTPPASGTNVPEKTKEPASGARKRLVYVPPKAASADTRVDGDGGSRSGGKILPPVYVLTPHHTGLTTQAQPSLFWYQRSPAGAPVELTLIEPKNSKPLLRVGAGEASQSGIHRLVLGKHKITLAPGVTYKWTVALVPDRANRSQDVVASGTIQRVTPDAPFAAELAQADGLQKAALYAGKGFWYDALEVVTNEIDAAPKDKSLRQQRARLLEQAGLKEAAASELK